MMMMIPDSTAAGAVGAQIDADDDDEVFCADFDSEGYRRRRSRKRGRSLQSSTSDDGDDDDACCRHCVDNQLIRYPVIGIRLAQRQHAVKG